MMTQQVTFPPGRGPINYILATCISAELSLVSIFAQEAFIFSNKRGRTRVDAERLVCGKETLEMGYYHQSEPINSSIVRSINSLL